MRYGQAASCQTNLDGVVTELICAGVAFKLLRCDLVRFDLARRYRAGSAGYYIG